MLAAGTFLVSAANAEIVLTEDLSVSGYLDIYAQDIDLPGDNLDTGVAEFELVFNYTTEPYFSVVELSFDGEEDVSFETAIVGYNVNENLSLSAGNILSYLGWETYDATGLYQYSYAYGLGGVFIPGYAVGVAADYVTDDFSLGVWLGDSTDHDISYELMAKFTGVEGFTFFVGWADDPAYETLNFWASYEVEGWTFAAEYADTENDGGPDGEGYLLMANYAFDQWAITGRYSVEELEGAAEDWVLFTISPSYTFSDNLLGLAEVSFVDEGAAYDYWYALELIYTF